MHLTLGVLVAVVLVIGSSGVDLAAATSPASPAEAAAVLPVDSPARVAAAAEASPAAQAARLQVGDVTGSLASATIHVARERGYFADQGIDVQMVPFDSGARMVPGLVTGQIDVAAGSASVGAYNAAARDLPFKIVADLVSSSPQGNTGYFMIRKDLWDSGAVRDYPDFRGKRLSTTAFGTSVHAIMGRGVERGGATLADAEIIEMGFGDTMSALAGRSIDVGFLPDPLGTLAEEQGVAQRWRTSEDVAPGNVAAAVMFGSTLIQDRPDVARRFMVAYVRGCRDYYEGMILRDPTLRPLVLRILSDNSAFKDPALLDRVALHTVDPDGRVNFAALESDYRWYVSHGLMSDVVDLRQVVDNQFVDYAVQQLGPYRR